MQVLITGCDLLFEVVVSMYLSVTVRWRQLQQGVGVRITEKDRCPAFVCALTSDADVCSKSTCSSLDYFLLTMPSDVMSMFVSTIAGARRKRSL